MSDKPTKQMFYEDPEPKDEQEEAPVKTKPQSENKKEEGSSNMIDLPSEGRLGYPSSINYREILVKDEEAISNATSKTSSRTLNKVLSSIAGNPDWFNEMSIHDRDFFMVSIWVNSYSPTKEVEFNCPKCEKTNTIDFDFTKQKVDTIHPDFKGKFEMDLKCGQKITVRLNTVEDEMAVEAYLANNPEERFDHLMMVRSIEMDFPLPMNKRIEWVNNSITGREMAKIKDFHIKLAFGFKNVVDLECEGCGEVVKDRFPFDIVDFLQPTVQSDIAEFL